MVACQEVATNTATSRGLPMHLHVFLDPEEEARGQLYMDDGDSMDPVGQLAYTLAEILFTGRELTYSLTARHHGAAAPLTGIWVAGLGASTASVTVNAVDWPEWEEEEVGGRYYLQLTGLGLPVDAPFAVVIKSA